ncbi:MAG: glycosyltransferase family 2 protein [Marinibacterium sp.]|nr:glycosyltransferase family 2 protein [Marinibacterium sp.]
MTQTPRITAITCMRNEGPFVLEWIAYHRLIGADGFVIYTNDCDDGTDALLDRLAARGLVAHLPNPAQGRAYQMAALKHARSHPLVQRANWIWVADVDEFPNIHAPGHRFADLIASCGDAQAISLSFRHFANAGVDHFDDLPVTAQFTRTHNPDLWADQTAIEVKTLTRRDFPLRYFGAHRPFARPGATLGRWCDGSGRPVPEAFLHAAHRRRIHKIPARGARALATLNHYPLRALDSYLVKVDRGDVNRAGRAFDLAYWQDRNDTACEDRSIARLLPDLHHALDDLLADPDIAAAHAHCLTRHRARIAALRARPDMADLRARLRAAAPYPVAEAQLRAELGYPT